MKLFAAIKLGFNELISKKTNVINIMLFSIVSVGIILSFSINDSLNQYWKDCTDNIVEYRTFMVFPTMDSSVDQETRIKKLKKIKHVIAAETPSSRYFAAEVQGMNGNEIKYIDVFGTVDKPVNIIKGENMEKYNNENVIICPQHFYPYANEEIDEYDKNKVINLTNMIGKEIKLRPIGAKEAIPFKLVGIYENSYSNSRGDSCYTKFSSVKNINEKYDKESYTESENVILPNTVVIDNVRNSNTFIAELENQEMTTAGPLKQITVESGDKIISLINIGTIVFFLASVCIAIFIELKSFISNKKEYGILKTIGYTNTDLIKINDARWIIMEIIVFLISTIIGIIALHFIYNYYLSNQVLLKGIQEQFSYKGLVLGLMINIIAFSIISLIIKSKLEKVNSIDLVKEL